VKNRIRIIFDRPAALNVNAMATAAERRFKDAQALCDTGDNERAVGAQYLCGFVIEILLKRQLVLQNPIIARKKQHEVTKTERQIWSLIWRSHELPDMLDRLPDLLASIYKAGERDGKSYLRHLNEVCGNWTIQARYSPQSSTIQEARDMLDRVKALKEKLK
jgi:hypothetical protein